MTTWINFKELRKQLDFKAVLKHYGVELKLRANNTQHHGFCPLPKHVGKRNSPSFSAHLEKNIFHCFGCGAKGNALEFAALMENVDPANGSELRKVAIKLQQHFGISVTRTDTPAQKEDAPKDEGLPVLVNAPLDFQLKNLDATHPYLASRGFTPETIAHFGLGLASRGSLKDRIAIPIHDHGGKLVGYAGRVVDDSAITEENPRYRFPAKRTRNQTVYEFHKTLLLYNEYRIAAAVDDLIVVEGFTSVWWLCQNGLLSVVATMGADCSQTQAERIVALTKPSGHVWLLPDGDEAGERFAESALPLVSPLRFVRWLRLAKGKQPTDLKRDELRALLTFVSVK